MGTTTQDKPVKNLVRLGIAGGVWLVSARWLVRGAHITSVVLLARLLSKEEYGLVASTKVLGALLLLGSFGMQAAIIQQREEVDRHVLDVSWTYDKFIRGALLAILLLVSAPAVALYFNDPRMVAITRTLALVPLLQGAENNGILVFTRELEYRKRFALEAANGLTMLVTVVVLAFVLRSVWAFVFALLAGLLARAVLSYALYPVAPRMRFDLSEFRKLFRFGRWMLLLKWTINLREHIANLVLVGMLGPVKLGVFHLGARFSGQLGVDLNQSARKVLFPIYAKVQDDPKRMSGGYQRALQFTWMVLLPFFIVLAVLAEPLVFTVFGSKWQAAVPVVRWMSLAGAIKGTTHSLHPLLSGRGTPWQEVGLSVFYLASILPLLIVLTSFFGVIGTCIAVTIAEALQVPPWLWLLARTLQVSAKRLAELLIAPLALTAASGAMAAAGAFFGLSLGPPVQLLLGGLAALAGYIAITWNGRHSGPRDGLGMMAEVFRSVARRIGPIRKRFV